MQHFSYYEIYSIMLGKTRTTGMYYNLERAKKSLAEKAAIGRPDGKGDIYRIDLTVDENLEVKMTQKRVFSNY